MYFKDYNLNPDGTAASLPVTITHLSDEDISKQTVCFYWADVGDNRKVTVYFFTGAKIQTATATFNVKNPDVTFPGPPPLQGSVMIDPLDHSSVALMNIAPNPNGMVFTAQVDLPKGFNFDSSAKWDFTQLAQINVLNTFNGTPNFTIGLINPTYELDAAPYREGATAPVPTPVGTSCQVGDSPDVPCSAANLYQVNSTTQWYMYILFLPAQDPPGAGPSKWVALKGLAWSWNWCAGFTKDPKNPVVLSPTSKATAGDWVDMRLQPQWDKNALPPPIVPDQPVPPRCKF